MSVVWRARDVGLCHETAWAGSILRTGRLSLGKSWPMLKAVRRGASSRFRVVWKRRLLLDSTPAIA